MRPFEIAVVAALLAVLLVALYTGLALAGAATMHAPGGL